MNRVRKLLPSPAMVLAIGALVVALAGTSVAAGLGILNAKAKNKTVGVGPLTYVTTTNQLVNSTANTVSASCPSGTQVIGGGVQTSNPGATTQVDDSYPTATGWTAHIFVQAPQTAFVTAICATSRRVTGAPPAS